MRRKLNGEVRTVKTYDALIDGHFSVSRDSDKDISIAIGDSMEPTERIQILHEDLEPIIACLKKAQKKWKESYSY